jgi:hypothetical protein
LWHRPAIAHNHTLGTSPIRLRPARWGLRQAGPSVPRKSAAIAARSVRRWLGFRVALCFSASLLFSPTLHYTLRAGKVKRLPEFSSDSIILCAARGPVVPVPRLPPTRPRQPAQSLRPRQPLRPEQSLQPLGPATPCGGGWENPLRRAGMGEVIALALALY